MVHDYDTLTAINEPNEFQVAVCRGIVGGALFTFIGFLNRELPELDTNKVLAVMEKFEQENGFDFDRTDARFWDEVVAANHKVRLQQQNSPAQPEG